MSRMIANLVINGSTGIKNSTARRAVIIGQEDESLRVKKILEQAGQQFSALQMIVPTPTLVNDNIQLDEIVRVHRIEQVVFCARDISSADIITAMSNMDERHVEFKIAPPESLYIIGSGSIETSGDPFMMDVNSVSLQRNRRLKRTLDIGLSILMILLLPVLIFIVHRPVGLMQNLFRVLSGNRSWVGFHSSGSESGVYRLPRMRPGVLTPADAFPNIVSGEEAIQKLNVVYAKDYRIMNDVNAILRAVKKLGREA